MCHIISSYMSCPAVPYIFPHYLINGTIFGKELLNTKCFDFPYNFYLKHLILWRIQQDIVINVHRSLGEVPVILVILMKLNFSGQIFKYSNFIKMHPMGAKFHVDRWTHTITLTVAFYNFVNTPTKESISWNHVSHHLKVTSLSL
jgi:hypothetical protein